MDARRIVPLVLLLFVLGACLAAPALAWHEKRAAGPDPMVQEWPRWPHRVTCGGLSFKPAVAFASPTGAEKEDTPQIRALNRFIREDGPEGFTRRRDWRRLAQSHGFADFASGRLPEVEWIELRRRRGKWRFASSWSNCHPMTLRHGRAAITWDLHPKQPQLTAATRSILVDLGPGSCDGGEPQRRRLMKPEFREENGKLLITLWLRPLPPGAYTCEETPEPPVRIKLPEPLGSRELADGGIYPPELRQLNFGR